MHNQIVTDKAEYIMSGYRFSINVPMIQPVLVSLIDEYETDKIHAAEAIRRCQQSALPTIQLVPRIKNIFLFAPSVAFAGVYWGHTYSGPEIDIAADRILQLLEGKCRDKDFSGKPREWFAYVLAHELRHWIQNIASYPCGRWHWGQWFRESFDSVVSTLLIIGPIFFVPLLFLLAIRSTIEGIFGVQPIFLNNDKFGWFAIFVFIANFFFCRSRLFGKAWKVFFELYHRILWREKDADAFGMAAVQNPEWVRLVSIEKI